VLRSQLLAHFQSRETKCLRRLKCFSSNLSFNLKIGSLSCCVLASLSILLTLLTNNSRDGTGQGCTESTRWVHSCVARGPGHRSWCRRCHHHHYHHFLLWENAPAADPAPRSLRFGCSAPPATIGFLSEWPARSENVPPSDRRGAGSRPCMDQ
jgi:hypothetical protein